MSDNVIILRKKDGILQQEYEIVQLPYIKRLVNERAISLVADIDNSLLNILEAIENHIKWYDRSYQETYSFSEGKVGRIGKEQTKDIYELFKEPRFFLSANPTSILPQLNKEIYNKKLIVYTEEPLLECFIAKSVVISSYLPDVDNIIFMMYGERCKDYDLANKDMVLKVLLSKSWIKLIDDHPKAIKYANQTGNLIMCPNFLYVKNTIKNLNKVGSNIKLFEP